MVKRTDDPDQLDLEAYIEQVTPAYKKTETVEEAEALLKKYRRSLIVIGRQHADYQIRAVGWATTASVYEVMKDTIPPGIKLHWLPMIFRNKKYRAIKRNVPGVGHDDISHVWTFAEGYE